MHIRKVSTPIRLAYARPKILSRSLSSSLSRTAGRPKKPKKSTVPAMPPLHLGIPFRATNPSGAYWAAISWHSDKYIFSSPPSETSASSHAPLHRAATFFPGVVVGLYYCISLSSLFSRSAHPGTLGFCRLPPPLAIRNSTALVLLYTELIGASKHHPAEHDWAFPWCVNAGIMRPRRCRGYKLC